MFFSVNVFTVHNKGLATKLAESMVREHSSCMIMPDFCIILSV